MIDISQKIFQDEMMEIAGKHHLSKLYILDRISVPAYRG